MKPVSLLTERLSGCADLSALVALNPQRYSFLLESVSAPLPADEHAGAPGTRFDILFACPGETLQLSKAGLELPEGVEPVNGFLDTLDSWWQTEQRSVDATELPFTGGWFLYLGYELAVEVEPSLDLPLPNDQPTAFATRVPAALINDRDRDELILIAEEAMGEECLQQFRADLRQASELTASGFEINPTEDQPQEFLSAVVKAKEYIRQGDVFQANLSRRWTATLQPDELAEPVELYQRLCASNPAPFAGLIHRPDFTVISSSPERLVRRTGHRIDTRPIAGTRPRCADPDAVRETRADLLANPKERAEHIMLIDLERNDLGRVCEGGSVCVDEFMVVESYSHVHHIVSNVTGTARAGLTPGELIRAVFPGGTITGCPKVRCMEIIRELEQRPRGAYTGSMGYLNLNGDCDLNILIRTITLHDNALELEAGSGIVADSDPQRELQETRAKAKGMLLALSGAD